MLSHLDRIVFADRCEVIEIVPSQRYVYSILKNGSSSIHKEAQLQGWQTKINEQIRRIDQIDVILRNPRTRLISGINTYIQIVLRDNPKLDPDTVEWFALNYLYLNSHYCPQFMWMLNLSRYARPDIRLNLLDMTDLKTITHLVKDPGFGSARPELIAKIDQLATTEMYQRVDEALIKAIGQQLTMQQLWLFIQDQDPAAYDYVIGHAQRLLSTTYALS